MKIEDIKDLEAVIKLLKKHGVQTATVDGISITLDLHHQLQKPKEYTDAPKSIDQASISEEELMFWST